MTANADTRSPSDSRASYNDDGYLLVPDAVIPRELVERAIAGMDAVRAGEYDAGRPPCHSSWNPGDDPSRLCKIEQPQFANYAIRQLVGHSAIGELAAAITGASMVQAWWVQLLYKPPTPVGTVAPTSVGWHQDRYYWGQWERESQLFTAWVALSEVDAQAGAMVFLRGSHKWGFRNEGDFFEQDVASQRKAISVPEGAEWNEQPALLHPGGLSFHDCLTFHGSGPNHGSPPRRSFAIHLRTERSRPVENRRAGLTEYIDDLDLCPILFGKQ